MKNFTTTRRLLAASAITVLFLVLNGSCNVDVFSQEQTSSQVVNADSATEAAVAEEKLKIPPGLETYMGREIAQTMHYKGAPWLIRDEREREERCSLMLANLGIRPQMVICDMGCGVGFHSTKMAQMTGAKGYVAGVDVQPEMLDMMRERMEEEGIENIIPILGSFHNPRLPRDTFDMVLMVDVYHEFSHPEQMLAAIRNSLKPDGVVVLVEYRAEDKTVPIKPEHKMSKDQVEKELTANGLKLVKSYDKLPWQHMLFYGRDDARAK